MFNFVRPKTWDKLSVNIDHVYYKYTYQKKKCYKCKMKTFHESFVSMKNIILLMIKEIIIYMLSVGLFFYITF